MKWIVLSSVCCLALLTVSVYTWRLHQHLENVEGQLDQTQTLLLTSRATTQTLQTKNNEAQREKQDLAWRLEETTQKANTLEEIQTQLTTTRDNLEFCETSLAAQHSPMSRPSSSAPLPSPAKEAENTSATANKSNFELEPYVLESLQIELATPKTVALQNERFALTSDSKTMTTLQATFNDVTVYKTFIWQEDNLSELQLELLGADALKRVKSILPKLGDVSSLDGKETVFVDDGLIQLEPQDNGITLTHKPNFLRQLPMIAN
jgi:hypothetical protein